LEFGLKSLEVVVGHQHGKGGPFGVVQELRPLTHDADLPPGDCGAEQDHSAEQQKGLPEQLASAVALIHGFGRAQTRARIQSLMAPRDIV
jgi:hypothetical protein